jgi:peptidoglycan hydrolase CwlO-like protein
LYIILYSRASKTARRQSRTDETPQNIQKLRNKIKNGSKFPARCKAIQTHTNTQKYILAVLIILSLSF